MDSDKSTTPCVGTYCDRSWYIMCTTVRANPTALQRNETGLKQESLLQLFSASGTLKFVAMGILGSLNRTVNRN